MPQTTDTAALGVRERLADATLGTRKPVENVHPGGWVLTYDENERPEWIKVRLHLSLTHDSGRKATELRGYCASGKPTGVREWNNDLVTAMTAAQARKAGLS